MRLPHLIALCGKPGSGKSEVQKILWEKHKVVPVDDGHVLRAFAMNLGLSRDDVYTQDGKKRHTEILGKTWRNRDILGTVGDKLEEMFGKHIMPYIGTRNLDASTSYSFGSVRRDQGRFYQSLGGIVIEVVNSYAKPSDFEFDAYDKSIVDHSIMNDVAPHERGDGRVRRRLEDAVAALVARLRDVGVDRVA